jgi:iron complex transport system substrate-binding protein
MEEERSVISARGVLVRSAACGFALLLAAAPARAERSLTDSAGRVVRLPDRIERVFAAGPPAAVLLYVLAPDRLTGWPRAPRPEELPYLMPATRDLPELGMLTGRGDTANLEVVLKVRPDLILDFGSVRDTYVSLADRVQAQTGIPYVLIDGTFAHTAAAIRLLGRVLGVEDRAERLAAYVEASFAELDRGLATIPESDRRRVYLARGPDGLETGLEGSINTEIIERAGAINVARDPTGTRHGIVQVPIEQVVVWNPDTVITWDRNFYRKVWQDAYWQGVDAVRAGRVYLSPMAPFGWIDRPPSLNRIIGLRWLAGLFYPEHFRQDLRAQAREFYSLFYHVDLTEADLDRLLESAKGRAR